MIVTTEAIVLHSRRFGDSSRIVTVYGRELGKVGLVAKGARTTNSSLGPALEPLSHARCTVYHTRNRELHTVTKAETASPRRQLHHSYEHLQAGMLMCELIIRTQAQEQPDAEIFELLRKALDVADTVPDNLVYSVSVAMRLRLAEVMGFGIQRAPYAESWQSVTIDVTDGSVLHSGNGIRLSMAAYAVMHHSLRGRWGAADESVRLEIEAFLSTYFSHHLDTRIVSRTFTALQ
ncbi:MAG: hypothetical protein RL594_465 [Bacteroidota bacterium]